MFKVINRIAGLLLICVSAYAQAEPTVSVQLSSTTVNVGDVVTAEVWLNDFPQTQGGSFTVKFSKKVLKVESVTVDEQIWNMASNPGVVKAKKGKIKNVAFASFPGLSGNVLAATIEFSVIGKGKGKVKLLPSGANPFAGGGELIDVSYSSAKLKSKNKK